MSFSRKGRGEAVGTHNPLIPRALISRKRPRPGLLISSMAREPAAPGGYRMAIPANLGDCQGLAGNQKMANSVNALPGQSQSGKDA